MNKQLNKQSTTHCLVSLALLSALSVSVACAAGQPVHLHLSAERETVSAPDAEGKTRIAWGALTEAAGPVHPGDHLRYRVQAENDGAAPVSNLVVTQPVPAGTVYVAGSADGSAPTFSLDGKQFSAQPTVTTVGADGVAHTRPASPESYVALRWRLPALAAHTTESVTYQVRVR